MRLIKKIMIIVVLVIVVLTATVFLFMQTKVFGKNPTGKRLERIEKSPNYKDGAFQNLSSTPTLLEGASYLKLIKAMLTRPKTVEPPSPMPSVQTNLKTLQADKPTIVWFGHSSYLIKSNTTTVLVDPVFSGHASPVSFFAKAFPGADVYGTDDFPDLDVLVLTHDHYDHLDYETILKLQSKVKKFCVALGVGEHLEHWGISSDKIVELDWWESSRILPNVEFTATPARHFSGRGFTRAKSLWVSYVLKLDGYTIYLGGDSGYDTHFKTIGEKYGPFDLVLLESGQYGVNWPYIHMLPEQTVQAAKDLKAKRLMPVHWGKFVLALHDWNEPIKRVVKSASEQGMPITTPKIGEPVIIDSIYPSHQWWNF